ncbi:MAG: hypothetical protein M1834_006947 [Cirrosporium novae-zelandiae]|nr:MAG: hypothetical protein M1834_006947 [Cirrosporium novae-zelandiae]
MTPVAIASPASSPLLSTQDSYFMKDDSYISFDANPYTFKFHPQRVALVIIDMQRDFLLKDGFGYIQAGDAGVETVQATIKPTLAILKAFRECGLQVIHTREGHRPDLRDCPTPKLIRQARAPKTRHSAVIGDEGPMGRLLTRNEYGHDIIDELQPLVDEIVIDKPGKGSFFSTGLHEQLVDRGITHIIVAGVTVECCVTTTVREANDRGFDACILSDCTDGFVSTFKTASLDMIRFSEGLFGFVSTSKALLPALASFSTRRKSTKVSEWDGSMDIDVLKKEYAAGLSPVTVIQKAFEKISSNTADHPSIWISLAGEEAFSRAEDLEKHRNLNLPLYGIPFAIKDNIDVVGMNTTAGCPAFSYKSAKSAFVVDKLVRAGAIIIGKTNLDQFATGLVGTRSPYGACYSVYDRTRVSGGSSSGSANAVALGQVSFALGTDTAGSGRIPAGFNGIVGLKPTKGTISALGVVPACKTLDCVSIFAKTLVSAKAAWLIAKSFDPEDSYSRASRPLTALSNRALLHEESKFTFSVPPDNVLKEKLCSEYHLQFEKVKAALRQLPHADQTDFNFDAYLAASDLVYKGAFVAERMATLGTFIEKEENKSALLPVTRKVLSSASSFTASTAFNDLYEAQRLTRIMEKEFDKCDVLIVPTAPRHPTIKEVEEDPIGPNLELGAFASAVNVLDLAAIAIPAGTAGGLPFGISVVGPAFREGLLLEIARRIQVAMGSHGPSRMLP